MRETIVEELQIAYHSSTLLDGILVFYDPKENFYSNIFVITISKLVTFVVVVFAFVLFRAETIDGAMNIYTSMLGFKCAFFYTINDKFRNYFFWILPNSVDIIRSNHYNWQIK